MQSIVDVLESRGLLDDMTSADMRAFLAKPRTIYAGFDPTSESLQAGNLVAIMALAHFQRAGHRVIAVVGGATGMIGDPSGKSAERNLLSEDEVRRNQEGIRENLSRFLDFEHAGAPAAIANNYDWLGSFTFIEFLRDVGKHFRMGAMLGKDSVRSRLSSESGMSFAEFSYQLLQGYDFLHLYDAEGCMVQIGGSDQWGNITAGIDLVRKLRATEVYGLTIPLLCDSGGQKFGKSEGNAVYLDHRKTSYYDFYQFFLRTTDEDVLRFMKVFTFLPVEEIDAFAEAVRMRPERREAQKRLAEEVTRLVHGEEGLRTAQRASAVLFGQSLEGLRAEDLVGVFRDVPSATLPMTVVLDSCVVDLAVAAGFCRSKSEARRLIQNGGFYLNNARVACPDTRLAASDVIDGAVVVLRSGKKTFHLVKISD
jgi:tyrosyl-tRNA synthetase